MSLTVYRYDPCPSAAHGPMETESMWDKSVAKLPLHNFVGSTLMY